MKSNIMWIKMLKLLATNFILVLIYPEQFNNCKNIVAVACNTFNDFCDAFDENMEDLKENPNKELEIQQTSFISADVKLHNYSGLDRTVDRDKRSSKTVPVEERQISKKITTILDKLLFDSGYDRQISPRVKGTPLEVK